MRPPADIADPRVAKALAHPLRVRILGILEDRTASPSELAEELDAPLGNVSYHVRQLAMLGLVKMVRKTPRRGTIEHYYRAEVNPRVTDSAWAELPKVAKQAMVGATLSQLSAYVNSAAGSGGFDRANAHLTRTQLILDEQGFEAVARELAETLKRLDRIQAATSKRLAKQNHVSETRANVVMMLFESAELVLASGAQHASHQTRRTKQR